MGQYDPGMRTATDIYRILDGIAPFSDAAHWDPVGIQVGDPGRSAEVVAVCHEVTATVVTEAAAAGVDVLVAYHPVLFAATQSFVAGPTPTGRALALATAGITLIVTHTAFDVAAGGTADALAESLGLDGVEPFGFVERASDAPAPAPAIGRIGIVDEQSLAEFAEKVAHRLKSPAIRIAGDRAGRVARVAVVPGSGSDFSSDARAAQADVLVTGDVSHHRAVSAVDQGLSIIDAGHIPTERPGMKALRAALGRELGADPIDLTRVEVDPWA